MNRIIGATLAVVGALGWLSAARWRNRSEWASKADIDQLLVDVITDCFEEPDPETEQDPTARFGYASVVLVRAKKPPVAAFPWHAVAASTRFEVDEETGLRIVHSDSGWYATKDEAREACATLANPPAQPSVERPDF